MEYFKIMVTVAVEGLLCKLSTETKVASVNVALQCLSNEINIPEWKSKYLNPLTPKCNLDNKALQCKSCWA